MTKKKKKIIEIDPNGIPVGSIGVDEKERKLRAVGSVLPTVTDGVRYD